MLTAIKSQCKIPYVYSFVNRNCLRGEIAELSSDGCRGIDNRFWVRFDDVRKCFGITVIRVLVGYDDRIHVLRCYEVITPYTRVNDNASIIFCDDKTSVFVLGYLGYIHTY